jgi:hypothetical protein
MSVENARNIAIRVTPPTVRDPAKLIGIIESYRPKEWKLCAHETIDNGVWGNFHWHAMIICKQSVSIQGISNKLRSIEKGVSYNVQKIALATAVSEYIQDNGKETSRTLYILPEIKRSWTGQLVHKNPLYCQWYVMNYVVGSDENITILHDAEGQHGKSSLIEYLECEQRFNAYRVPMMGTSVLESCSATIEENGRPNLWIIDQPRNGLWNRDFWYIVEELNNGDPRACMYGKAMRKRKWADKIQVIIFCNDLPEKIRMSEGRVSMIDYGKLFNALYIGGEWRI